jgi:hypothetical protein
MLDKGQMRGTYLPNKAKFNNGVLQNDDDTQFPKSPRPES